MEEEDSLSNLFNGEEPETSRQYFDLQAPSTIKQEMEDEHIKLEITDADPLDPLGFDDEQVLSDDDDDGHDDDDDADIDGMENEDQFQKTLSRATKENKRLDNIMRKRKQKFYFTSDMKEKREIERLKKRIKFLEKKLEDKEEEMQQWMLLNIVAILKLKRRW